MRPRVYKQRQLFVCQRCNPGPNWVAEKPWMALSPQGARAFDSWRDAYNYASAPLILMNQ